MSVTISLVFVTQTRVSVRYISALAIVRNLRRLRFYGTLWA